MVEREEYDRIVKEVIANLAKSISVFRKNDNSYDVSLGDGVIRFTINDKDLL